MALTEKRKGELAVKMLRRAIREKRKNIGPLTDEQATDLVLNLTKACGESLDISYGEVFELYRELFPEDSQPAFDRAVSKFGQSIIKTEAKTKPETEARPLAHELVTGLPATLPLSLFVQIAP